MQVCAIREADQHGMYSTILYESPDSKVQVIKTEPDTLGGFHPVSLSCDPSSLFGRLTVVGYGSNASLETDCVVEICNRWSSHEDRHTFPREAVEAIIWLADFKHCVQANYDPAFNETAPVT
jgi:hypothetical protein